MITKIIDGISEAIYQEFGDGYDIYTESIEQGLEEPCFSILCLNPTSDQFLGMRYFRMNQFMIQYFPSTKDKRGECHTVTERLFDCLETIMVFGDLSRGTRMGGEVVDDVLNFRVNFDMFVYKIEPDEVRMETHSVNTGVRSESDGN